MLYIRKKKHNKNKNKKKIYIYIYICRQNCLMSVVLAPYETVL